MAKQPGQKLKLLYLLDILREQTDEEHGLGMKQIRMMLQNCTNSAKKDCCCRFAQWQREQDAKHPFVLLTEGL